MRVVRGAAGSGKTALIFREFREALRERRGVRIVVPTATLVRHFQHELARDGVVLPASAVTSLSRFARERAPHLDLVPDGLRRVIVRDVLRRLKLPEFAEVAGSEGMAATLVETIDLFENAACTPEKLAAVRRLTAQGKAFAKVWRGVNDTVHAAGFATRADVFRAAAKFRDPAQTLPEKIWLDGFLNFSPLENDLIRGLAKSCDLTLALNDSPASDEMRRLAMELGAEDRLLPGTARKPGIVVVAANSIEREADEIARRVIALSERGRPFREIGIALRDSQSYVPVLRSTFERFGIPARFYFSGPLRKHPAAIFLNGLISCVLNGWEFGSALDALRAHPRWGQTAAFDRFDFAVREAMPGQGVDALLGICTEDYLKKPLAECLSIDSWNTARLRPAEWRTRFEDFADALYRPGTLDMPRDHRDVATARGHVAALRAWVRAAEDAAAFWPDQNTQISLQDFWSVAKEVVDATSFETRDDRRDAIHVMSVFEARQWDITALFVCGMTDRDFPKKYPQNLLFAESDIGALKRAGIPLRGGVDHDREELALFDALRTRARESLTFSYPAHDSSGKSAECSRWLLHPSLNSAGEPEEAMLCRPTPPVVAAGSRVGGRIDSPALLASLAAQHVNISLTSLEDLAQCRFRFFAGRTLGLKGRPERPGQRLQPRLTGLILHEALEAWLNANREGDFVSFFDAAFERTCRLKRLPPGYQLETERLECREIARKVSSTEQWSFISSEAEVELALDFPGGITVNCRIDRIDQVNERDCIVIDYKSSRTARVEKLVESTVRLQGPLYALAVRERRDLNTIAMMYVAVREDKRFGWGEVPGVELNLHEMPPGWIEDARSRAIDRLTGFLAGAVWAEPVEVDQCRWCDYRHTCRYQKQQAVMIEGAHGG